MTRVVGAPCPQTARAWWGDTLLAQTSGAVRVEQDGREPELHFPLDDIRLELFRDEGRRRVGDGRGDARLWSIGVPASGSRAEGRSGWLNPGPDRLDGRDVLWSVEVPVAGLAWLSGLAAFDHDRVRVELLDPAPDDPLEVSVKRFPTWGDAADLIDLLDVRPDGPARFVSVTRPSPHRPVVEGSQMLGQAIVAAGRHAPGRRLVSGHMVFLRAADAGQPLEFELEELGAGRTFTTLTVQVAQGSGLCAAGLLLLDVTAPDVIRHTAAAPDVPGPHQSEPYDMSVTGRDIRVVDGAYTDDPDAPPGPPVIDTWVRFHRVPEDACLHAALLAQFTGHMSIAAALRPHEGIGQRQAHRTLSTAINAISLSLHAPVRADRWMLYHHESTFAGDGMTRSACRVHDRHGGLLASFAVDGMVRGFAARPGAVDDRTAL